MHKNAEGGLGVGGRGARIEKKTCKNIVSINICPRFLKGLSAAHLNVEGMSKIVWEFV